MLLFPLTSLLKWISWPVPLTCEKCIVVNILASLLIGWKMISYSSLGILGALFSWFSNESNLCLSDYVHGDQNNSGNNRQKSGEKILDFVFWFQPERMYISDFMISRSSLAKIGRKNQGFFPLIFVAYFHHKKPIFQFHRSGYDDGCHDNTHVKSF